jgi:uncharacterized protein YhfF
MTVAAIDIAQLKSFQFGNTPHLADRLVSLVIAGRKTASCWAAVLADKYTDVGERWVARDGRDKPVAVIETLSVTRLPFSAVTPAMAALEGEGDLSYAFWKAAHVDYFTREGTYAVDMDICFEVFRLVEALDETFAFNARAHVATEIAEAHAAGFTAA